MTVPVPLQRLASTLLGGLATLALLLNGIQDGWALTWLGYGVVSVFILWHRPGNAIPVLTRVQGLVDVRGDLQRAVTRTLQPAGSSLWLRGGTR